MTQHENYPHIFRPLKVGNVEVRNRIFVPAHTTNYGEDNLPSQRHLAYHRARAAGGAGLIIFEGIRVHKSSRVGSRALMVINQRQSPGLVTLLKLYRVKVADFLDRYSILVVT